VDVLINNAGVSKSGEFSELSTQDFEDMIRVNYLAAVYCTKSVIDSMKDRRSGRIAFVCSQAGQIGVFGYTAYSASKFALRGLAETLQMETRPYNVSVTLSFPPDTDTPGFKQENLYKVFKKQK
jgi:3-dehydrosphinganine reductase